MTRSTRELGSHFRQSAIPCFATTIPTVLGMPIPPDARGEEVPAGQQSLGVVWIDDQHAPLRENTRTPEPVGVWFSTVARLRAPDELGRRQALPSWSTARDAGPCSRMQKRDPHPIDNHPSRIRWVSGGGESLQPSRIWRLAHTIHSSETERLNLLIVPRRDQTARTFRPTLRGEPLACHREPSRRSSTTPIIAADPDLRMARSRLGTSRAGRGSGRSFTTPSTKCGSRAGMKRMDIMAPRKQPILAVEDGRSARLFESKRAAPVYQFDPTAT